MPSVSRIEGLDTSNIDLDRLKFASGDLARRVCRVENGACGYQANTVVEGAVETACERVNCGFDTDRFAKGLLGILESLRLSQVAPDELESRPDFSDSADFDVNDSQRQ